MLICVSGKPICIGAIHRVLRDYQPRCAMQANTLYCFFDLSGHGAMLDLATAMRLHMRQPLNIHHTTAEYLNTKINGA